MNGFRSASLWSRVAGHLDACRMRPEMQRTTGAILGFWSLLLPTECAVCGCLLVPLCPECGAVIRKATVRPLRVEGGALALPQAQARPEKLGLATDPGSLQEPGLKPEAFVTDFGTPLPVTAGGHYRAALARLILAYKNHHRTDVGRPLQAALAGALHAAVAEQRQGGELAQVLLVPVPVKGSSLRRRGYDPLGLLLAGLVRRGELPAGCRLARLVRYRRATSRLGPAPAGPGRRQQKGLGSAQRRANVRFSMTLRRTRHRVPGAVCLVVDDVLTTGATIAEVTRVLRRAGAEVVGAAVVAATEPPSRAT